MRSSGRHARCFGSPVLLLSLALAAASPSLSSGPPVSAGLPALFREAWAHHPEVLRARADAEDAAAARAGAWLPNPELEASVRTDAPLANLGELELDVGLVQEVSWPGAWLHTVDGADAALAAARARLAAVRLSVAADVEAAVGALVAARRGSAAREELLVVARAMGEAAKRKLAAGSIGALEASLTSADAASAAAAALGAQATIADAEAALCAVLGRAACAAPALEWPALVPIDREQVVGAMDASGIDARLDVRAATLERSAASERLSAAELAWLPSVKLGVGYGFQRSVLDVGLAPDLIDSTHLVGALLSIPLPLWDWRRRDVLQARADVTRADALTREATQARSALPAALARLDAATASVEVLHGVQDEIARALVDLERAYDAGALPLDTALTARDRLLKARLDYIEAQSRRVRAHADLLRAISLPLIVGVDDAPVESP